MVSRVAPSSVQPSGVADSSQDDDGFHGMIRDAVAWLIDDLVTIEQTSLDEASYPTQV